MSLNRAFTAEEFKAIRFALRCMNYRAVRYKQQRYKAHAKNLKHQAVLVNLTKGASLLIPKEPKADDAV